MEEWKEYKLSELGAIIGGATPSTKDSNNYDGEISWITPKDLSNYNNRYIFRGERMITRKGYDSCSCKMLPQGSVLFSSRAPIGYVAIAGNELCTNQGFKSIVPDNTKVNSMFVYYLLIYNKNKIEGMGTGTTFKEVSGSVMRNVAVKVPSLPTQQKIANILSSLDDKIEVNRRINEQLEELAQALFKSWFVDFEPFKDGEFVESELGMIPEGWKVCELQELVNIKRGGSPRPIQNFLAETGYNWLKISDATSTSSPFIYEIKECIKEEGLSKTVFLKAGNLVLSNSATPGIPKFLGIDSCIHDGWLYFPKSNLSNEFLYLLFKYKRNYLISQGNGSVFTNLKTDIVKMMQLAIPDDSIISSFDIVIKSIFENIKKNQQEITHLTNLRDTLLP